MPGRPRRDGVHACLRCKLCEHALKIALVEPHNHLAVNKDDGHAQLPRFLKHLVCKRRVGRNVLLDVGYAFLRKEPLRQFAVGSGGSAIDDDRLLAHVSVLHLAVESTSSASAWPNCPPLPSRTLLSSQVHVFPDNPVATAWAACDKRDITGGARASLLALASTVRAGVYHSLRHRWPPLRQNQYLVLIPHTAGPLVKSIAHSVIFTGIRMLRHMLVC